MSRFNRRQFLGTSAAATAALVAGAPAAFAQSAFPAKPINFVVGSSVGGGLDTLARLFSPFMSAELNDQPLVVQNRPGAGQVVGLKYVAAMPADGYHIDMASGSAMIGTLFEDTGIDMLNDFVPIANVAVANLCIVAPKDRGFTSTQALYDGIVAASEEGRTLRYAHTGIGSITHVAMESWLLKNGLSDKVQGVPFDGGAPARTAMIGGHVDFGVVGTHHWIANQDTLDAVAIMNDERDQLAPEIESLAESGLPYVAMPAPYMLLVPSETPAEVIETLANAVAAAVEQTELQEAVAKAQLNLVYMPSGEAKAYMERLMEQWAPIVEQVNAAS